jgi:hypothetical protein
MEDLFESFEALNLPDAVKNRLRLLQPSPIPNLDVLVNRLSLLRTFTERTFCVAVEDLSAAPSFETFTAISDVEQVIGYPGRFSVVERVRSKRLPEWSSNPGDRARWARTLVDALDPNDSIESLDRVQALFLADQDDARRALLEAFDAADRANDIAMCSALVQLVAPTVHLFGDARSRALLNEIRSRSQSRNLFFSEFYHTERYYARAIDDEIRRFARATDEQWIFHLHAAGGMGKTMLLRRMISHEWVLGPTHAPCAWVDFDYLEVSTVLQHPALLGLAMAAQWNEQLELPVFGGFLNPSFQPLASLLFRNRTDASARGLTAQKFDQWSRNQYRAGLSNPMRCGMLAGAVPPRTIEERTQRMSQTPILLSYWIDKLPEAIAAMPADRPMLLVLDTLEDASLQQGRQLFDTLRLLASLREQARKLAQFQGRTPVNLRLVLSGRYQLGKEHVPEFAAEFAGQYIERMLTGLRDPEARAFLDQQIRSDAHLGHRGELLDAMVSRSAGFPFNLSLFAEWANDDDTLDAKTVLRSEDVSTAMLIERIVKRIPYQPLRWIIRYGVVPRSLSFDFLRDVMRGPLLDALSGRASAAGVDKPESTTEQDVWKEEQNFIFDPDLLWDRFILPYTSERSWIKPGESPHQVAFRSDILQPMRSLLRKQPIFERLHEQSRDWFGIQASDPSAWSASTIEHLYHAVQLRAIPGRPFEDFVPALRQMLDAELLTANPRLRAGVCNELRKPDFADLTSDEQTYVLYRLAEALAAEHDYSYRTPEAVRCLTEAFERQVDSRSTTLPPFAFLWKHAMDGASPSAILGAIEQLPADDALRASLLFCELSDPGSGLVSETLEGAMAIRQKMKRSPIPVGVIAARLAQNLRARNPEGAVHYFMMAAADFNAGGDPTKRCEMLCLAAETELNLGRLTRAEAILTSRSIQPTPLLRLQLARLELDKGNPGVALDILHAEDFRQRAASAEGLVLEAEALSQRMLLNEATEAWERASRSASQQGDAVALNRIAIGQAKLYYWWLRAVPAATPDTVRSLLHRSQAITTDSADTTVSEIDVWQILYGQPDVEHWRRRALGELGGNSPTARIRLIFALSHLAIPLPTKRWAELVEHARQIPPSARVAALAEPVLQGEPPKLDFSTRKTLAETFRYDPEGDIEGAWYAIRHGELLAWLGFYDEAVTLLARWIPGLEKCEYGQGWGPAVYRQRRRIEQRIRDWDRRYGKPPAFPSPEPDPAALWLKFLGHTPFRASAALVENAQRARDADHLTLMRECLDSAAPGLEQVPFRTAFHVMTARLRASETLDMQEGAARATYTDIPEVAGGFTPLETHSFLGPGSSQFGALEMRAQSGRVAVQRGDASREQLISPDSRSLEILLRSKGIPRRLAGFPLDAIVADLEEFISQTELNSSYQRTALRIPLSPLCCAPWEMAFGDVALPFRLPSQSNESEFDAKGQVDSRRGVGLLSSEPVLLQPFSQQDMESPAADSYRLLGLLISRRLDQGRTYFKTPSYALYAASSLIEIPNINEPALAGVGWTATTLAHTIRTNFTECRPIVILDVPAAVTAADFVHQLLLRNYFAQALVDSGAVACVLATGLHPSSAMSELQHLILEAIATPASSRLELFDRVTDFARSWRLSRHDALFTSSPYGPLCTQWPRYA